MPVRSFAPDLRLALALALGLASACGKSQPAATATPEPAATEDEDPDFEDNTYVSTSYNEQDEQKKAAEEAGVVLPEGDWVVTTPGKAKELAEAAVTDQLDPKKSWKLSPVLPASWPSKEPSVVVFFYPMAANPQRMTQFVLYSAAWKVTVSLVDGTTEVHKLSNRRTLGTIEETRATSLERRELDMAEATLVYTVIGADMKAHENPYWGYLKFVHEHPKVGRDLSKRSPAFFGWVKKKHGR